MSEIPFVHRLGDAIESAIAAPAPARRRRRRRLGGLAVAVFLLGASGATVAAILDDPEKLATTSVACYDSASFDANVAVLSADGRPPTEVCANVLGTGSAPLSACVHEGSVAVFPGGDACGELGLDPVPAAFAAASDKVARLSADLRPLEDRADCVPPETLARQAQGVLDRNGWTGWTAVVRAGAGPCGTIHVMGGSSERTLGGVLDAERHELSVSPGPPRSLERLLYGEESIGNKLFLSGASGCYSLDSLTEHAREVFAPHEVIVRNAGPLHEGVMLDPPSRQANYDAGCAIPASLAPVYPRPGEIAIEVEVNQKG